MELTRYDWALIIESLEHMYNYKRAKFMTPDKDTRMYTDYFILHKKIKQWRQMEGG